MHLVWTLLAGLAGVLGVLAGVLLLGMPGRLMRDTSNLRHWLYEADVLGFLNTRCAIEKPVYRHHRFFGTVLTCAAALWMWLLYRLDAHYHLASLAQRWLGKLGGYALIAACWMLAFSALAIGLFLIIRPSAMKPFEAIANRWIEPFPPSASPEAGGLAKAVFRAQRLVGVLLLVAGIECLMAVAKMIGA